MPEGKRIDTRKHTGHVLSPEPELVEALFADLNAASFARFARAYRELLDQRFRKQRAAFDELADLARAEDVYIGCNCPTAKQPDVKRCHTTLALQFMREKYKGLRVVLPS